MKIKTAISFVLYYLADWISRLMCFLDDKFPKHPMFIDNILFSIYNKLMSSSVHFDVDEKVWR
jgi:hypothetical protein